jgi:hypothetical protein
MLKNFLFVILCLTTISCEEIEEKDFTAFSTDFIKEYTLLFPDETPLSKSNEKLAFLAVPTLTYFDSVKQFQQRFATELKGFDVRAADFSNKRDAQKIGNILKGVGGYLSDYGRNPLRFNVLHGFKRILESNHAPDNERLETIFHKLEQVPAFYEAAKQQLTHADRPLADAAVEQHIQTYLFFDDTLTDFLNSRRLMTPQYCGRIEAAKLAVKDYIAFVESFRVQ